MSNAPQALPAASAGRRARPSSATLGSLLRRQESSILIGTLAIFAVFAHFGGREFSGVAGTATWVNVAAELAIVAVPVGLVMIAGELDLSVGSVLSSTSMTLAVVSGHLHHPIAVGIVAALVVGAVTGLVNGVLVTRTKVPSFIITLATMKALQGLTLWLTKRITGSTSVALTAPHWAKTLFGGYVHGFEYAVFWAVGVIGVCWWVLHISPWGNWVFAVGGDADSARAGGIPTSNVKILLFVGSALSATLIGLLQTVNYNSAQVANGQSFVFNSIIAVVIGGALLTGGDGSVLGVVLGACTFAIVGQGIYFTGWTPELGDLILGAFLLVAVLTNNTFRRKAMAYVPRKKGRPS